MSEPFARPIDACTRCCAVFGHPIIHSASPAMQNAGIAALGLNWRYLAFDVGPDQLRAAIAGAKQTGFMGVNLTVPHKLAAIDLMDALDDSAKMWGAVNTIRFETAANGELSARGFNTDADAITQSLRDDLGLELRGRTVLLLGAGGAGRVAALRLAADGVAELHLVNRTGTKAEAIAAEVQRRFPSVQARAGYPSRGVDLVLNATSLGMRANDGLPLDEAQFSLGNARFAYDMIYRPAETAFLEKARAAGCRVANGLGMLLHQGAKALEIWSGQPAPVGVMRRALELNIYGAS